MTIEWLAGNRIRGTSTERTTTTGFNTVAGVSGGWKELGRTTLGSAGDTISVASLADKRYYMVLTDAIGVTSSLYPEVEINGDTANNYAYRRAINGGADTSGTYKALFPTNTPVAIGETYFAVDYLSNLSAKEKLGISHDVFSEASGSGNAPSRQEHVSKWANTSTVINRIDRSEDGSGEYNTGSELVVLGWDPADTHTTNFWEELASVNASGSSTNLSSGTITAKKYLWIQCFTKGWTTGVNMTFNNDTGNNYARRYSNLGAADGTSVNEPSIADMVGGASSNPSFTNIFIVNNSANEKLAIGHNVDNNGTGATNYPDRIEMVGKWANTSAQITEIDLDSTGSNFSSNSILKVWGSN